MKALERKSIARKNGLDKNDAKHNDGTIGQTRDIVAQKLSISGRHWERMRYIYQHKSSIKESEYLSWKEGEISTSSMYNKLSKEIKGVQEIDDIICMLDQLEDNIRRYRSSYVDSNAKQHIAEILFSSPKRIKDNVTNCVESCFIEKRKFIDEQDRTVYELKRNIINLKKKLSRYK